MVTEEQRKKISETLKRRYANGELKARDKHGENNPMFGRKQSEETKEKIRQKAIGRKGLCGKDNPATWDYVRLKMSQTKKGKIPWNKGLKGWVTKEHKEKIKKGVKKRKDNYGTGYLGKKAFNHPLAIGKEISCPVCDAFNKKPKTNLELHHKDRNKKNNVQENIVILCRTHHIITHIIFGYIDTRTGKKKKIGKVLEKVPKEEKEYIKKHLTEFIK